MLDSTRDLVLNYELYNANNTAILNTFLAGTHQILRLTENNELIPDNSNVTSIITRMEQNVIIDEKRKFAEQPIISNNYHNIFELNVTLMNTSQKFLSQISKLIGTPVFDYQDPITTIQNIFRNLSQSFISAFLTLIDD
jgi:hypothetical protein